MARTYSRKKGKAGSTRPLTRSTPSWSRIKDKEVEMLIVKLFKEDMSPSHIGLVLRDSYGVPDVKQIMGKNITKVLEDKGHKLKLPEDLLSLMVRANTIRIHMSSNKQDMTGKRGRQLTDAKINALVKYYKNSGKLPVDFKYNPNQLNMYIE